MGEYLKLYGLFCYVALFFMQFYVFFGLLIAYIKEKRWVAAVVCVLLTQSSVAFSIYVLFKVYEYEVFKNMMF